MDDPLGALVPHGHIEIAGAVAGPLAGATFVVKDIFDVAGTVTGRGNADWLASHRPAEAHAPVVRRWLEAGARLVGKAITEELAFSVVGINPYYGAPKNTAAPGRVAGGSSSGSAAAVGGGLADLALGSDTGGSVRVPASYNGIYGMRPSHGRIDLGGVMPLAPSFDTVGWFAREPGLFAAAGRVLLDGQGNRARPGQLMVAEDAFARTEPGVAAALAPALARVEARLGSATRVTVAREGLDAWYQVFRTIQGAEAWASHGAWIETVQPRLGPLFDERLRVMRAITATGVSAARKRWSAIADRLDQLLGDDGILVVPSAAGPAPSLDADVAAHEAVRDRVIGITSIAVLGRLPQVSLPVARMAAGPIGLSLIGPRGSDEMLLDLVAEGIGAPSPA